MRLLIAFIAAGLVSGVAASAGAQEAPPNVFKAEIGGGGRLGVRVEHMGDQLRAFFGAPADRGLLVGEVEPGSPAEKAGLRAGDVMLTGDGRALVEPEDLIDVVQRKKNGEPVALEIVRDHKRSTIVANVRAAPAALTPPPGPRHFFDSRGLEKRLADIERRLQELEKKLR